MSFLKVKFQEEYLEGLVKEQVDLALFLDREEILKCYDPESNQSLIAMAKDQL